MTNSNINTNNEGNVININSIINRDGKAGELFQNIGAACENAESLNVILELEKELDELKAAQPDYKYLSTMIDWLAEAKENAENAADFEAIKAETLASTGDESLAEDIAWELVYSQHTEKALAIDFSRFTKAYDMIHTEATKEQRTAYGTTSTVAVFA